MGKIVVALGVVEEAKVVTWTRGAKAVRPMTTFRTEIVTAKWTRRAGTKTPVVAVDGWKNGVSVVGTETVTETATATETENETGIESANASASASMIAAAEVTS